MTVIHDPVLTNYVNQVGKRLASAPEARQSGFPFTFEVVADPSINAFALPGGPMFINTGLLRAVDNEAQLAGVMGHEMSHVVDRDILYGTIVATVIGAIVLLSEFFLRAWWWGGFGGRRGRDNNGGAAELIPGAGIHDDDCVAIAEAVARRLKHLDPAFRVHEPVAVGHRAGDDAPARAGYLNPMIEARSPARDGRAPITIRWDAR